MGPAADSGKPLITIITLLMVIGHVSAKTHYLYWNVVTTTITRNCNTVNITTVNGKLPGPTVEIDEGDTLVIRVTNHQKYPISIHWHGIKQHLTNWADGPAYITQCPLLERKTQIYKFTVTNQSGTFLWHAHATWLRATVYGAFIVHPKDDPPYGKVAGDIPILFGSWLGQDPEIVESYFQNTIDPGYGNATTVNTVDGQPGPLNNCSTGHTRIRVKKGSTYLLRLINAALLDIHYFKVANHTMTVVAADGNYLQPFTTNEVVLAPGQTTNVLLTANQPPGTYYFGIEAADVSTVHLLGPTTAALATIEYEGATSSISPVSPDFPSFYDAVSVTDYLALLKNFKAVNLPKHVDHKLEYLIAIAVLSCTDTVACNGSVTRLSGTVQNMSFVNPQNTSILEAYYNNVTGVYTTDFPDQPTIYADYTNQVMKEYSWGFTGRKVKSLKFGDTVQLVIQNVYAIGKMAHPFHLHGHDFYVIGGNYGNDSTYNATVDPSTFNLVDPPKFNTYTIQEGAWVAIRFTADNPGVWLFHCHFETHTSWGMGTVFITSNGDHPRERLPSPPSHLPRCGP